MPLDLGQIGQILIVELDPWSFGANDGAWMFRNRHDYGIRRGKQNNRYKMRQKRSARRLTGEETRKISAHSRF